MSDDFRKLAIGLQGGISPTQSRNLIGTVTSILARHARQEAPERTGQLRQSIISRVDSPTAGRVDVTAPYGRFVHDGAPPHIILPKFAMRSSAKSVGGGAAVLAFQIGGVTLFRMFVRHPGNKPNPFLDRAVETSEGEVGQASGAWLQDVATQLVRP